jgi:NAD(P)-dependent dehydrogenase (short-subunit alcohol dehydrogenase family)
MIDQGLTGQVAAVTGAAQGIGFAIAQRLHEAGAHVCLLDLDPDAAAAAAGKLGARADAFQTDVTDEASLLATRDAILGRHGRTDILINNAGVYPHETTREITVASWDQVFAINARGPFLAMRAFMDSMIDAGYGRMVSIVTTDSYIAKPNMPHYAASKAALLSIIRTYAADLAPHNILVNGVSPGAVATERAKSQDWLARAIPNIPVQRAAEPGDIAEVVAFLASPANRFVTGETVVASGGAVMV